MNKRILKQAVAVVAVVELLVGSLSQVSTAQAYTHSTIAVESTMKGVSATSPFCVRYADGTVTPLSDGKVIRLTSNANFADIILKDGASNQYTSVNIGGVDYTQDELCILEEYDECLFTVTNDIRTLTLSALAIDGATCTFTITIDASALASDTPDSPNNSTDSEDSEDSEDSSNDSWYDSDDEDAPTISGVSDEAFYNKTKTITFEDEIGIKSIIINDKEYITDIAKVKTITISKEGEYKVRATDVDGSTRTLTFVIDKTAPTISGVSSGKRYSSKRKVSFEDKLSGVSTAKYSLSGAPSLDSFVTRDKSPNGMYKGFNQVSESQKVSNKRLSTSKETTFKLNGTYKVIVTDKAGNETSVTFTINDTHKPSLKFEFGVRKRKSVGKDFSKKSTQTFKTTKEFGYYTSVFDEKDIMWIKYGFSTKGYPKKANLLGFGNMDGGFTQDFTYASEVSFDESEAGYGGVISEAKEGYYLVQIKTMAGNITTYKFRIKVDKKVKKTRSYKAAAKYNSKFGIIHSTIKKK